ncbi:MAG: 16S rRNA (uracil(1498)-N(3))-methyltransferase [Spirochaetales bacterium]|nr:16S rRNA (uracil(1498)-N(3))-methyltransferase [Spirochaetales bacterium]
MKQFLIPDSVAIHDTICLEQDDYHYLVNVLRVQSGDSFTGIDRKGMQYLLSVLAIGKKSVTLQVKKNMEFEIAKSPHELVLYQGVPKLPKMDDIVRMTTEAGISKIVPVITAYCQGGNSLFTAVSQRTERWKKIAREAVQQSGRKTIPEIMPPVVLREIPAVNEKNTAGIFGDEAAGKHCQLHELFDQNSLQYIVCVVGPEGGFHDDERKMMMEKNIQPVSLGANVLRVETAAIYLCAVIQFLLLEKNTWISRQVK